VGTHRQVAIAGTHRQTLADVPEAASTLLGVLAVHVCCQVEHTVGVSILVVVPADNLQREGEEGGQGR